MGRGDERRFGEKKDDGSGRTVDWDSGKVNGWRLMVVYGLGSCLVGFIGLSVQDLEGV